MIQENIDFLKSMVSERRDLYSIFSFLSESLDVMRTNLQDLEIPDGEIYLKIENLLDDLESVDYLLDSYNS
ncbi:MAG: hypothetical protein KDK54_22510 [Leptospiraceae bacterium]|nr:hypothetical protein [Leptospiraceae bacterium]